jgi:SNF2 family DNA or RNA helicase
VATSDDVQTYSTWEASASHSQYSLRTSNSKKRHVQVSEAIPSSTTLIVVPSVLLEQWASQIFKHTRSDVLNATNVFIDDLDHEPLPRAEILSKYFIILTTHKRLTNEWRRSRPKGYDEEFQNNSNGESSSSSENSGNAKFVSPLLEIVFYRVAFDEGHQMGRGYLSESLFMASTLLTKCSWLLTGTPTPSDQVQTLSYLFNQFVFLKHSMFLVKNVSKSDLWRTLFSKTFQDQSDPHASCSVEILSRLLSENMIRHTKKSIFNIPKPFYKLTRLVLSAEEIKVYNTLVTIVRINLVLTGLDYRTPGALHPDSLLNPANKKALREAIVNLRMSTAGAGSAPLVLPKRVEILEKVAAALTCIPNKEDILVELDAFIECVLKGNGLICQRCNQKYALLIFTPCCHTFCPDCLNITRDFCCVCNQSFDWDLTQIIQPGFSSSQFIFSTSATTGEEVALPMEGNIWNNEVISTVANGSPSSQDCIHSSKISYLMNLIKGLSSQVPHAKQVTSSMIPESAPKIIVFRYLYLINVC